MHTLFKKVRMHIPGEKNCIKLCKQGLLIYRVQSNFKRKTHHQHPLPSLESLKIMQPLF